MTVSLKLCADRETDCHRFAHVPVFTSAAQAAMVTGLAADAAGLAPGGGSVAVVGFDWFV